MSPAGTGGLAKVTAQACAQQHTMGHTMTPAIGEIINFFEGRVTPRDFTVSFTLMFPLIIDTVWRVFNNTVILTLITQN